MSDARRNCEHFYKVKTFDFGWVHSPAMDNIGVILQDVISGDKDLSSYWASKEKKVNAGLEKINAAYEKAGE